MYVCVCLGLCMGEKRLQGQEEGFASLQLEFQVVVSCLMQVSVMKFLSCRSLQEQYTLLTAELAPQPQSRDINMSFIGKDNEIPIGSFLYRVPIPSYVMGLKYYKDSRSRVPGPKLCPKLNSEVAWFQLACIITFITCNICMITDASQSHLQARGHSE